MKPHHTGAGDIVDPETKAFKDPDLETAIVTLSMYDSQLAHNLQRFIVGQNDTILQLRAEVERLKEGLGQIASLHAHKSAYEVGPLYGAGVAVGFEVAASIASSALNGGFK